MDPLPSGSAYALWSYFSSLEIENLILLSTSAMQVRFGTGAEDDPEVESWRPSVPDSYWAKYKD